MALEGIGSPLLWLGFIGFVLGMLAIDLGVFHRKTHAVSMREALTWSGVWIGLALLFGAGLTVFSDGQHGVEFFTGYLIEKSLSVDNIFVFVVIFAALRIPAELQHRVLFWGILSALVLRAAMIVAGAALFAKFHWLMYVFGGFLILTGVKLVLARNAAHDPSEGWAMRLIRRVVPSSPRLDGQKFFTRENGKRLATPLFLALLLVELSDVLFALDSIPAIFAVTTDPFIVFTSNIFAILGLRSLFFLLAGMVDRFRYLKLGLAGVLVFVGAKMILVDVMHLPPVASLAIIAAILGASVIASLRAAGYSEAETASRTALATTERGAA
ncbi:MAG: TerC family protein [Deltaproteobacteria bacterium]|nr:TerC family protein [Deltaproteobacteria bacterium]